MASTYALPTSAVSHGHHSHAHVHTHSHSSPSRPARYSQANTAKALKPEGARAGMHTHAHTHSHPEHHHDHDSGHAHSHAHSHDHSHASHGHTHSHTHERPADLPNTPDNATIPPPTYENHSHASHTLDCYTPPSDDHNDHSHHHHAPNSSTEKRSRFTNLLLSWVSRWPVLHSILLTKDSRRIFYFMSLNFSFMIIQAFYGFLTDSLGLLSDSIHMFFDCLALGVGLFAAIASKWPPSERFPYGFGMIESLSGFGNGVFLMLISIEIIIEATERLSEGRETKRLAELFIVSSLGLAVNLVGMACFGHHGHAGHDHSHGHSHGHDHSHSHAESHSHSHENHDHHHAPHTPLLDSPPAATAHHSHSHDNDNMRGIFLHVLADTMGSAAVIVSTILIHFIGWSGWDPLASCVIAILIFLSSIPLVTSCARKLLLTIPDGVEYNLRNILSGVSDLRGVASYTVPRFWMGDKTAQGEGDHIQGVMHIHTTRGSDMEDVRQRTRAFLMSKGMDVLVQVEVDGEDCWCESSGMKSPSSLRNMVER